jgi:formyl-CoA transferase
MLDTQPQGASALGGLRVLDMSRVLAGPYCAMMLGDLGADVVKVESPVGDDTRRWGPPYVEGEAAYYLSCNRNKRGIVLDLSTEEGRDTAHHLAMRADVLVENFKLGQMERWGLGYDALAKGNPRLVYCGVTGFGRTGPLASQPGYDFVIQGMGGMMSITGEPDGEPMRLGVAIVDLTAGMLALSSILAALYAREKTGKGQRIDMSLLDTQLGWLANIGSAYLLTGRLPERYGNAHPNIVPYQAFKASDVWFTLAVGNDQQWARLCTAIKRPDLLEDARFATNDGRVENRDALIPLLQSHFETEPAESWLALFSQSGVPAGPINDVGEALRNPHSDARGAIQHIDHPTIGAFPTVASPLRLEATPPALRRPPPLLGQHTDEVLAEWLG